MDIWTGGPPILLRFLAKRLVVNALEAVFWQLWRSEWAIAKKRTLLTMSIFVATSKSPIPRPPLPGTAERDHQPLFQNLTDSPTHRLTDSPTHRHTDNYQLRVRPHDLSNRPSKSGHELFAIQSPTNLLGLSFRQFVRN